MQIFVSWEVFDTITGEDELMRVRQVFGEQVKYIFDSGKVVASGCFADGRSGFFLLDLDSTEDLFRLLGDPILDHCRVETHPVMSYEKLAEYFFDQEV